MDEEDEDNIRVEENIEDAKDDNSLLQPEEIIKDEIKEDEKEKKDTLKEFGIESFSDKENIGIWYKHNDQISKIAAIGVRVKKWIAYHGFAININNNLDQYKKIIPCGIKDKGVTNLISIIDKDYSNLDNLLIEKFISNLKI